MVEISSIPSSLTPISHYHDLSSASAEAIPTILSPMEAESIVSSIREFPIREIGSSSFLKMFGFQIEKLSLQAHASASNSPIIHRHSNVNALGGEDEYVIDLILTYKKVSPLVQTLLAIEAWRTFILTSRLPSEGSEDKGSDIETLIELIAKQGNSLRVAFILHAETTIVSLLTLMFYRRENIVEIENSILLSLVDYCARRMASLAAPLSNNEMIRHQKNPPSFEEMTSKALLPQPQSTLKDMMHNLLQTEYQSAVKSTSLARYLCEHFDSLSISIQTRILNTHDFLMLFIPLIDEPPWTRRRSKPATYVSKSSNPSMGDSDEILVWEKFIDQEWKEVQSTDLLNVTQCEAQCWIAVFHLTCSNANCREQYGLNTYRKEQILRLRKFMNEYLIDQLPILSDVTRYMDELSLMYVPECGGSGSGTNSTGVSVLMEQIDQVRECLLKECNNDWVQVAKYHLDSIYSKTTDANDEDLRLIASIYNEEDINFCLGDKCLNPDKIEPNVFRPILDQIIISISESNDVDNEINNVDVFNLIPNEKDDGVLVQTPNGPFHRRKLAIVNTGDLGQFFGSSPNPRRLKLKANIAFKSVTGFQHLGIDFDLPTRTKSTKNIEWIQLGTLENNLVLQLGFKHCSEDSTENYSLEQAYLAQPNEI